MYLVYILESFKTGRYYIGCTEDPEKRLIKHNKGWVRSTKAHQPWRIIYKEEYTSLSEARKREKQIKSWKKRSKIEQLISGPIV